MQERYKDPTHRTVPRWLETGGGAPLEGRRRRVPVQTANARQRQTARRLAWLQARWNDEAYFKSAVDDGRYLKLCNLLAWAEASDDEARENLALTQMRQAG